MLDLGESRTPVEDLDAAEEWLDSWVSQVDARAERSVELSRRVAALTGSAEGRDGAIRVTVGSSGQVEALDLDDRVHELPGPRLAREIVAVMRRAQAVLAARVAEQVQATVGADSEAGRAVIGSFETRFPVPDRPDER
ncbi:YbaB/EbfC family nucleoid-associated protein [Actinoplanes xinjiangensis]|uniref:YbaB/EbfC family nucleoid-associated protein n=1 Tax=Actinoplanes xinjiangensis TaxID=512350 RepID=UPI000D6C4697|nr:YbaB/EbfC family nucleoid-associated protein [Actinoplanes xinjiangensis]